MQGSWVIRRSLALFVLLSLAPISANAQAVASNFEDLRLTVKPGDTVYVTDDAGRERRGRILELSPSSLLLFVDGTRREFNQDNVTRIRQRRRDPLWNGAAIGAASAMALATLGALAFSDRGDDEAFGWSDVGLILYIGSIGAGIGTGIDALIQGRKVIYERSSSWSRRSFGLAPVFSSRVAGVRVSFSF